MSDQSDRTEQPSWEDNPAGPEGGGPLDVDAESGRAAFVQALKIPRNAKIGLAAGVLFTAAVFVLFVVIPSSTRSPLWFLGLGFVLATSVAGLVAFVLTIGRAIRLGKRLQ